jgi:YD repeat-containing protein
MITPLPNPALRLDCDAKNRITNTVDGLGTSSYAYDAAERLTSVTSLAGSRGGAYLTNRKAWIATLSAAR